MTEHILRDGESICYHYWKRGDCVCCGYSLGESSSDTAIAEMVMMCGYCVERGHNNLTNVDAIVKDLLHGTAYQPGPHTAIFKSGPNGEYPTELIGEDKGQCDC